MLLQAYFWFMVIYLAASVLAKLLKAREYAAFGNGPGFWLEEVAGYVILGVGLLGIHGLITATPFLSATFWKAYLLVLVLFSAGQFFMPKMTLLRKEKGTKVVVVAAAAGILMLAPMFAAVLTYAGSGFPSAA